MFKNMSGNIPGGNFSGRNFPGVSLMSENLPGRSFPDIVFASNYSSKKKIQST